MYFIVHFLLFLWVFCNEGTYGQIRLPQEFSDLNINFNRIFNCTLVEQDDQCPSLSHSRPCSCSRKCSQFDTCCFDSRSNQAKHKRTCRKMKTSEFRSSYYLMIDRCNKNDSVWENLCNDDEFPEVDLLRRIPVTSLSTAITYKNNFCFRCHETTDDFVYWNVLLKSNKSENLEPDMKHDQLVYINQSWMVRIERNGAWLPVDYYILAPPSVRNLQVECYADLISRCNDSWSDDSVRQKCNSYKSLTEIYRNSQILRYRNPHCAVCNFENLSRMSCGHRYGGGGVYGVGSGRPGVGSVRPGSGFVWPGVGSRRPGGGSERPGTDSGRPGGGFQWSIVPNNGNVRHNWDKDGGGYEKPAVEKMLFSFTHLMDINPSDGDKVGRIKMCEDDALWDPIAETCRELSCALPGYVIKEQKCVPSEP